MDALNGQRFHITVHYTDETEASNSYEIRTDKRRVEQAEDGSGYTLLPEAAEEDEPYLYMTYIVQVD